MARGIKSDSANLKKQLQSSMWAPFRHQVEINLCVEAVPLGLSAAEQGRKKETLFSIDPDR